MNSNDVVNATGYYVYRDTAGITTISGKSPIASVATNNHSDTMMVNGVYYYAVVSGGTFANSTLSNCVAVTIAIPGGTEPPAVPGAPLVIVLVSAIVMVGYLALKVRRKY